MPVTECQPRGKSCRPASNVEAKGCSRPHLAPVGVRRSQPWSCAPASGEIRGLSYASRRRRQSWPRERSIKVFALTAGVGRWEACQPCVLHTPGEAKESRHPANADEPEIPAHTIGRAVSDTSCCLSATVQVSRSRRLGWWAGKSAKDHALAQPPSEMSRADGVLEQEATGLTRPQSRPTAKSVTMRGLPLLD